MSESWCDNCGNSLHDTGYGKKCLVCALKTHLVEFENSIVRIITKIHLELEKLNQESVKKGCLIGDKQEPEKKESELELLLSNMLYSDEHGVWDTVKFAQKIRDLYLNKINKLISHVANSDVIYKEVAEIMIKNS